MLTKPTTGKWAFRPISPAEDIVLREIYWETSWEIKAATGEVAQH